VTSRPIARHDRTFTDGTAPGQEDDDEVQTTASQHQAARVDK
jgi:hypothetical protein